MKWTHCQKCAEMNRLQLLNIFDLQMIDVQLDKIIQNSHVGL